MSTELTPIKGRKEIPDYAHHSSTYEAIDLLVTSFSGGPTLGKMIQLTLPLGVCHIQLTKDQMKDLVATLSEWLD